MYCKHIGSTITHYPIFFPSIPNFLTEKKGEKCSQHPALIVIWSIPRRKKNKFTECASTLNYEISFKLKVKSSE